MDQIKTKTLISNYKILLKEALTKCDKEGNKYAYDFKIDKILNTATVILH
jgi:hypothetical protein